MNGLSWFGIVRLGLVQAALGSIVVLTTSTLNRVMVVELALPALIPGVLVAIHYGVQVLRPRFGHGSDLGGRRTPWIVGGMVVLALGGIAASASTAITEIWSPLTGLAVAVAGFLLIGAGVGASGTSLLVLLAAEVAPERRAAAATITWVMMIAGFIVTTIVVGSLLDPFSFEKLIGITAAVGAVAVAATIVATAGIEQRRIAAPATRHDDTPGRGFRIALAEVLRERETRRFAVFVFISMLAYSAQDLLIEPFAGALFDFTPGESTKLGGVQHSGVLLGMLLVALIGSALLRGRAGVLRQCMIGGCVASALMLGGLAIAAAAAENWPVRANVFGLGFANGVFAVAAIGSMMALVSRGHKHRDGVRMGVWGAAQAIAFGLGGIAGTLIVDVSRWLSGSTEIAYALAFSLQAVLFVAAAMLAADLSRRAVHKTLATGEFATGDAGHAAAR